MHYKFRVLSNRLDIGFISLLKLDISEINVYTNNIQYLKESIAELIEYSLHQLSSSDEPFFDIETFNKDYLINDMNGRGDYISIDIINDKNVVADVYSFSSSPLFDDIEKLPQFGLDEIKFVASEYLEWNYKATAKIDIAELKDLTQSRQQTSMTTIYKSITLNPTTISDGSYVKTSDGTIVTNKKKISELFTSVPVVKLGDWLLSNNDGGVDEGFIVVKK